LDAWWTPVHVVAAAVDLSYMRMQPARLVELGAAYAEGLGRAEAMVAVR